MTASRFIQLHILTSYPAANLNRDDTGRPKTMVMGNTQRLRVSSQSLKRAWRTSDAFKAALDGHIGKRTKELGERVYIALTKGCTFAEAMENKMATGSLPPLKEKLAREIAQAIAAVFGALKKEKTKDPKDKKKSTEIAEVAEAIEQGSPAKDEEALHIEQLAHITPAELEAVGKLTEACRTSGKVPAQNELDLLRRDHMAVDVALFGRMLASHKPFCIEAAAQVAHAFTVHRAAVEDDFFTAVDDLNDDSTGAGHMGVCEFGSGLFYLYVCIDARLLRETLQDDDLASRALKALCTCACTVSPTGKQNSFASRAAASYCLAEKGDAQPRSLAVAFLGGVDAESGMLPQAIDKLVATRDNFAKIYGEDVQATSFNTLEGTGTIAGVCAFIAE